MPTGVYKRNPALGIARFWKRINKTDKCWLWGGRVNPSGYAQTRVRGKWKYVHRFSYEMSKGKIPKGLVLDHLCRNPICVNPDHLEAVTDAENQRRGNATKLTYGDVSKIRKLSPKKQHLEIANMFGVSREQISKIVNYKAWK